MNRKALFCDGTSSYVIPAEFEKNQKNRPAAPTAKEDVSGVFLVAEGREEIQMEKASSRGIFDYYETTWQLEEETFCYYFKIVSGDAGLLLYQIWRLGQFEHILSVPDRARIFHAGLGKRRRDVSDFRRSFLQWRSDQRRGIAGVYLYRRAVRESDGLGRTSNGNGCAAVLRRRLPRVF